MLYGRSPIGTCAYLGGVPAVLEPFCWAWGQMIEYNARYVTEDNECIHYDKSDISFHSSARNSLVDRMKGDWLFQTDTDHVPPPDVLGRLLHRMNAYGLDVVCGLYQFKSSPHPPVLYGWQKEGEEERMAVLGGWDKSVPIQSIAAAGGGCLLAKRSVFDRIRKELKENPFDLIGQMGEDLSFFARLRKIGVTPYFDCRVESPHLIIKEIRLTDYDMSMASGPELIPATGETGD